jgi:ABC-2 type transport system permease protein
LRSTLCSQWTPLPIAFSGISLQEGEEHGNEVFDKHYGRLFDLYDRQNRAASLGGFVSPMLAARSLSMALAGTDFAQHRDFVNAAEHYRREIQRVLNNDITENQKKGQVYLAGEDLWSRIPAFDYTPPPVSWVLSHASFSVLLLVGWLACATLVLLRSMTTAPVD